VIGEENARASDRRAAERARSLPTLAVRLSDPVTFVPLVPAPTPERPKWLSVCAAGVLAVAALAILGGLSAPIAILMTRHHPFAGMPGATPELSRMIALQQQMLSGPAALLALVVGAVGLPVGAWALYSAIRVLSATPGARVPFRRSVTVLVVTENASLLAGVWLQSRNREILDEFAKAFSLSAPGAIPPGVEETMRMFVQGVGLVGIVMMVAWGIGKLAVLFWAHRYTGTREVVDYLDR